MSGKYFRSEIVKSWLLGIVLCLFAIVIRLPYLNLVPFWSAGNENSIALSILNGAHPLINQNPHLGALSPYLVALMLKLLGFHSWVPRLVPFLFGIATVLVTWRLGTRTSHLRVGVMAAVLMSSAWYHVIFSSHYPWSNSLTPFFATAFLLVLSYLIDREILSGSKTNVFLSLLVGILFGMGMQTHPEMITLLPVIILVLLMRGKNLAEWIKNPVPWTMIIGGSVGYANMLWYNLSNKFRSVEFGLTYPEYALTKEYTATSVAGNYFHEVLYLPRIIFGLHDDSLSWSYYAGHPLIWIFWILLIGGLIITISNRRYLVPAAFLSSFLIIPSINSNYTLYLGRYLVFIFPTALILIGETLHWLLSLNFKYYTGQILRYGVILLFILLVMYPLVQVKSYYLYCDSNGFTRERYQRLSEMLSDTGLKAPMIILDQETGEGNDFHQFLKEEGFACQFELFRNANHNYIGLKKLKSDINKIRQSKKYDGIILIAAPWNRYNLLNQLKIDRCLGQIDARFENGIVDFYRVYVVGQE